MSDQNWCNILFTSTASIYLLCALAAHLFKKQLPPSLVTMLRHGKLADGSSLNFIQLPKSFMKHFYSVAAFVYTPVALYQLSLVYLRHQPASDWFVAVLDMCCGDDRRATVSPTHASAATVLVTLQIWRRFYDTHFVSVFSAKASLTLIQYFLGMWYYLGVLLTILSEAPRFAQGGQSTAISVQDVVAVIVFFWAWYHQHTTTVILANLRKNERGEVVTENYKIPKGDWFKYLSSPHYMAELVMYTTIWVLLGFGHGWWRVCFLVFVNQVDCIISSHQWYQHQFKNYPKDRKALLPWVI